jgi:multimeric flavodoxin WrbA
MPTPFILGVNGSPHREGIVGELLRAVLSGAEREGAETREVDLYALKIVHEPGYYSEDPQKETPEKMPKDDIVALYPDIRRADGLVLATPVYWANMSGVMKDFIDHLTALENKDFQLEGKVAACIAASKENEGGLEMAAMSMVTALIQMGVLFPPNAVLWYPGKWVTAEKEYPEWAKDDAPRVGRNMVRLVEVLRKNPIEWDARLMKT